MGSRSIALWQLAAGTALIALGAFGAWQSWLITAQGRGIERLHADRDALASALTSIFNAQRAAVQRAVAAPELANLSDYQALAAAVRAQLRQASQIEIYSGELDELLHIDYRHFGYAKAAQLLAAPSSAGPPLLQSIMVAGGRRLSLVVPLRERAQPRAWVWVELPFSLVEQRFAVAPIRDGLLQLSQDERYGDMVLLSRGSGVAEHDASQAVPGSGFSLRAGLPPAFIKLSLPSALALALLGLLLGGYLLWRWRHPHVGHEPMLADIPLPAVIKHPCAAAAITSAPVTAAPVAATALAIDPHMFRAYDIRGVVERGLDRAFAARLGLAVGELMHQQGLREIVIGRDGRVSGPQLSEALIEGLRQADIDVIDLGAVPTPVVYFAAFQCHTGCAIAITGSHNPSSYNGFKLVIAGQTLADEAIGELYRRMLTASKREATGTLRELDIGGAYLQRILSDVQIERPFKLVLDAGNGIAGVLGLKLLQELGASVVPLYCEVDGRFPNHEPDPSDPRNLRDLILAVTQTGAQLGLAFDGDGDRLAVVSATGEIIDADRLLMLFARDVLSRRPGATVIYDVKCSSHVKGQVLAAGGIPLMWRTGHSPIKRKMREIGAELAGEMSGHFFFQERWYGFDDGLYAAARLLEILAGDTEQRTPVQLFASLPKGVSTPELKIVLAEGDNQRLMEALHERADFGEATLTSIDGIRVDWPDGWGLVRASNTTPALVLRFDADNPLALQRIQRLFRQQLLTVDPTLALPF